MTAKQDHFAQIRAEAAIAQRALIPEYAELARILETLSREPADFGAVLADQLNNMLRGQNARSMPNKQRRFAVRII